LLQTVWVEFPIYVDLDLAVDLNDVPVIVQVHDDVQVHLQNGICTHNTSMLKAYYSRCLRERRCDRQRERVTQRQVLSQQNHLTSVTRREAHHDGSL